MIGERRQTECTGDWVELSTGCYLFGDQKLSWTQAMKFCLKNCAQLSVINNAVENNVLAEYIKNRRITHDSRSVGVKRHLFWIGFNNKEGFHDFGGNFLSKKLSGANKGLKRTLSPQCVFAEFNNPLTSQRERYWDRHRCDISTYSERKNRILHVYWFSPLCEK